jgi:hypothetical protein
MSHVKKKPAGASKSQVRILRSARKLRHDFTAQELGDLGRDLALAQQQLSAVDAERKTVMQQFNSRLGEIANRSDGLANRITAGFEMQDIAVEEVIDYARDEVVVRRADNRKVIERLKPIPSMYRQMSMPIDAAPPAAGAAAADATAPVESDKKDRPDPGAALAASKRRWRVRWSVNGKQFQAVVSAEPVSRADGELVVDGTHMISSDCKDLPAGSFTLSRSCEAEVVEVDDSGTPV